LPLDVSSATLYDIHEYFLTLLSPQAIRLHERKDDAMNRCEKCSFRARYDRHPRSLLGRLWKWHTGWCPGWKSYLRSLPEDEREKTRRKYA